MDNYFIIEQLQHKFTQDQLCKWGLRMNKESNGIKNKNIPKKSNIFSKRSTTTYRQGCQTVYHVDYHLSLITMFIRSQNNNLINYCILYATYFIYKNKMNGMDNICFLGYLSYFKKILNIEESICLSRHQEKALNFL